MTSQPKKLGRVQSAILTWLGVPISTGNGEFWKYWAGTDAAGQAVNEKTIMGLSAAWACTRLIAESVATLPLQIYEKTPNGRRVASELSIYDIIHSSPNANSTAVTYWESVITAMLLRGNGFSEKRFLGNRLVALDFLVPSRCNITTRANGTLIFNYTEKNGMSREIPWDKLWHVAGFSKDGTWGMSAIEYGASVFGSSLAAQEAANSTFEKGLSPTTAFTIDRVIKKEQREDFREYVKTISGALNAGESPLLEQGMDAKQIGISPHDAQLLESRAFGVEEVCRWFRVDPSMVGHGGKDSNFGTGLEAKMIGFLTFTLRPWLTRIEQSINRGLLTPGESKRYYAEFNIEGLLRADSKSRAEFYQIMVNNGIYTRDEVRELENRTRLGGNAEKLTIAVNMTTLDSLGVGNAIQP